VVAWYRPGGHSPAPERPLDWYGVDLLDPAAVERAVAETRPAQVFHLAGAPQVAASFTNAVPQLRTNVLGTHHLLEAVRTVGHPCRVLVVSSAQVYQPSDDPLDEDAPLGPATPYGFSKLAQDRLAHRTWREDGLDVVIARPFNHAGPGQAPDFAVSAFARQIARIEAGLARPELRVGNLDARRDMTDVRDVADAYERIMASAPSGRVFNVCSGRAWKVRDLLEELIHLARVPVKVSIDAARLRPMDMPVVHGDATRLRTELGWAPRIPVERMLSDTLEWWRAETQAGRS
jgi:GDP-4-dehydro-6-deoxy-D-mannose reductase